MINLYEPLPSCILPFNHWLVLVIAIVNHMFGCDWPLLQSWTRHSWLSGEVEYATFVEPRIRYGWRLVKNGQTWAFKEDFSWFFMMLHDVSWFFMMFHVFSWVFICFMICSFVSCFCSCFVSLFHDCSWLSHDCSWCFHDFLLNAGFLK